MSSTLGVLAKMTSKNNRLFPYGYGGCGQDGTDGGTGEDHDPFFIKPVRSDVTLTLLPREVPSYPCTIVLSSFRLVKADHRIQRLILADDPSLLVVNSKVEWASGSSPCGQTRVDIFEEKAVA